jgi:hypothetical protein
MGAFAPASAQLYEDARRSLGYAPDPIERSPRLLGMGRLTLVVDDPRNRISLWDFARNPTGILDDDSTSTLEFMPVTKATSAVHDVEEPRPGGFWHERQNRAAREVYMGWEAWHRTSESAAYGLTGEVGKLRMDEPVTDDLERRSTFTLPLLIGAVNGHTPYLFSDKMQYALHVLYGYQASNDRMRSIVDNAAGEWIDGEGTIVPPPDFFVPDEYSVRSLGGGGALAFKFRKELQLAVGWDQVGRVIKGENAGDRHTSDWREDRPTSRWQFTGVGQLGHYLEYGVDAQSWDASSSSSYVFSLSTGPAATPLASRGSLYERDEEGRSVRSRARSVFGAFEVGAGYSWYERDIKIFAPSPTDSTSFNSFLNQISRNLSADTLRMPDSVATDRHQDEGWDAGAGIGWTSPSRRIIAGAEFHLIENQTRRALAGGGPDLKSWNVRGGVEYALLPALRVRGGYLYRQFDRDELTANNEFLSNAASAGFGLSPAGASWNIEAGYMFEWDQTDFGDPGSTRGSRHEASLRIFWPL